MAMALLPSLTEIVRCLKTGQTEEAEKKILMLCETALSLQEENAALREEVTKLRRDKGSNINLEFSGNVYWLLEQGEKRGPFCPHCYDVGRQLSELLDGSRYVGKTRWICMVCNRVFD
jgi:hypothetical protein